MQATAKAHACRLAAFFKDRPASAAARCSSAIRASTGVTVDTVFNLGPRS